MSEMDNNQLPEFVTAPNCEPCVLPMVAKNRPLWWPVVVLGIGIGFDFYGIFGMLLHVLGFYVGGFLLVAGLAYVFWHMTLREAVWVCEECGTVQKCDDGAALQVDADDRHRFQRETPEQLLKTRRRSAFWGTFLVAVLVAVLIMLGTYLFPSV